MPNDEAGVRGEDGQKTPVGSYDWGDGDEEYQSHLPILELVGQVLHKRGYRKAFENPVPYFWYSTMESQVEFHLVLDHITRAIILIDTKGGIVHFEKWDRYGRVTTSEESRTVVKRSNIADPSFSQWLDRLI
jgi:hypothetical protein